MYICIDLKSFYASVECVERGLDPMDTNLVVADESRSEKTICLAVTPSLKAYGISGRARLFEVIQKVDEINKLRLKKIEYHEFKGSSCTASELQNNLSLKLDYITASPQMKRYMEVSAKIYNIYLRYIAPEDMHVYSIDEVFIDVSSYLKTYGCTACELAKTMIGEVLNETGITAAAGIGTNLYLAKIAMDITAKHMPADENGVRIAQLDEMSYRKQLWSHTPITDFWRVGNGISKRLESEGIYTMGDIARLSQINEEKLYKMFGVNAELLIDHAWGLEPCTMEAIKAYRPDNRSISQGQVLSLPYNFDKGRLVLQEMADALTLELVQKGIVTDQIVLTVGYDNTGIPESYKGKMETDRYGKKIPRQAHGSINLGKMTSSTKIIMEAAVELYDRIVNSSLLVRRMYIVANHVVSEAEVKEQPVQYSLFDNTEQLEREYAEEKNRLERERKLQKTMLSIKGKYGKNAILKGLNFKEGATAKDRNRQIGGHKA